MGPQVASMGQSVSAKGVTSHGAAGGFRGSSRHSRVRMDMSFGVEEEVDEKIDKG